MPRHNDRNDAHDEGARGGDDMDVIAEIIPPDPIRPEQRPDGPLAQRRVDPFPPDHVLDNVLAEIENSRRQRRLIERAMEALMDDHECSHDYWRRRRGVHQCEECYWVSAVYAYQCRNCRLIACARCRFHRL